MSVLELQLDPTINGTAKVVLVATSHSQTKLAVVPVVVSWCGEDAVLLTLDTGSALLLHISGETETIFQPAPLAVVQECDGVRIISQGFHDLVHRVDTSVQEIYRIASMSPG